MVIVPLRTDRTRTHQLQRICGSRECKLTGEIFWAGVSDNVLCMAGMVEGGVCLFATYHCDTQRTFANWNKYHNPTLMLREFGMYRDEVTVLVHDDLRDLGPNNSSFWVKDPEYPGDDCFVVTSNGVVKYSELVKHEPDNWRIINPIIRCILRKWDQKFALTYMEESWKCDPEFLCYWESGQLIFQSKHQGVWEDCTLERFLMEFVEWVQSKG